MTKIKDHELIKTFAERVTKLRKEKGFTLQKLAALSNIEYRQLARVERAESNPSISTIYAIAKGLEISFNELTNLDGFN